MVYLMKLNPHIAIIRQLVADSNAIVKRDGQAENREHIGGQMDGRTNGQKDRQTESWTDGQTDGLKDKRPDRQTDGWTDRWTDRQHNKNNNNNNKIYISYYRPNFYYTLGNNNKNTAKRNISSAVVEWLSQCEVIKKNLSVAWLS